MSTETLEKNTYEFKAEMKQLLHLIIHSLYTHPEIFLRELVSNSSDALNKIRFEKLTNKEIKDLDAELKINISVDKEAGSFSIEDTGIGMSKEDMISKLGTIASSGTLEFIQKLKEADGKIDGNMIGQFGVGFYSVFMVTDEVEVISSSSLAGEKANKWTSQGENDFTIEEVEKDTRGTKITFKLKDEYKEFAEDWKIKSTLKKYSNFVDFPIYVNDEKVNTVEALWFRKKDDINDEEYDDFYKFVSGNFDKPLDRLHLNIEGNINFKAVLFIPETAPQNFFADENRKTLQLYVNRVFIQDDNKDILPEYLKFVKGVVDCEDLPLNVSREVTQSSPVMNKISKILTGKIISWLEDLAKENEEKYLSFYKSFGSLFKMGANQDFANKERLMDLLRFESTKTGDGKFTSFANYVESKSEDQKEIYYFSGENLTSLKKDPSLEYFNKNNIEVLLLTDASDVFTIPYLLKYKDFDLKSIDKAEIKESEDSKENKLEEDASKSLIGLFKEVLSDKVADVKQSDRLVDSPVTLVAGDGMDLQIERMMKAMDKNFAGNKKILEINVSNPLIKKISSAYTTSGSTLELRETIEQLFDSAQLLQGSLESPVDFTKRLYNFMEKAIA